MGVQRTVGSHQCQAPPGTSELDIPVNSLLAGRSLLSTVTTFSEGLFNGSTDGLAVGNAFLKKS